MVEKILPLFSFSIIEIPGCMNIIFEEGKILKSYKTGMITPIAKKGKDSSHTDSYRGITVTSIQGKIFE
jgi:hypothetical protein